MNLIFLQVSVLDGLNNTSNFVCLILAVVISKKINKGGSNGDVIKGVWFFVTTPIL